MKFFRFEITGEIEAESMEDADNLLYLTLHDMVRLDITGKPILNVFVDELKE